MGAIMERSADNAKQAFMGILNDLDFHQSIISRTRGRFKKYPLRSTLYVLKNLYWKILIKLGHSPLITARTFWGDPMQVVFPAYRSIYQFGILDSWELIVQKTMIERLKEGDVFIDIGANVGFYTLLASTLVGDTGQVHAFEPTPSTFKILAENQQGKKNIHLNQLAIGPQEGEAILADFGLLECGLNSMCILELEGIPSEKITVKTMTLDAYCKEKDIAPTMIKVDVEGFEFDVLKGAVETLANAQPTLLLEVGAYATYAPLFDFLASHGYGAFRSTETLELVPYVRDDTHRRMNMVFIPQMQTV
jgi:FkbM family methyltransferase